MPSSEIFFLAIIIIFASFTQGLSGFGAPLIALPLLAFFLNLKTAIPIVNLIFTYMNVYLVFKLYPHIPWRRLPLLLCSSIPGIFAGAYILKNFSAFFLQIFLGVVLILFALYEMFGKSLKKEIHPRWEFFVGFYSGLFGGSINAPGPPAIIYCSLQPWQKDTIKSILVTFFFFISVGTSISYLFAGLMTPTVIYSFIFSIPFFILGTALGHLCYQKISEILYRKIIINFLLLSGALTLYKAFA